MGGRIYSEVPARASRNLARNFVCAISSVSINLLTMRAATAGNILDHASSSHTATVWPGSVPFTICEEHVKDATGRLLQGAELRSVLLHRGCVLPADPAFPASPGTSTLLNDTNAAQVRSAVEIWNGLFGTKIKFEEQYTQGSKSNIVMFSRSIGRWEVALQRYRGVCGTKLVGLIPNQAIKSIELSPECNGIGTKDSADAGTLSVYSILHEMMHAVGIYHEQSRSDRKQYVDVTFGDPPSGKACAGTFDTYKKQYLVEGVIAGKYDFGSVMHYPLHLGPAQSCSVSMKITPEGQLRLSEQKLSITDIGQRKRLSEEDIAAVRTLYP